MKLNKYLLAGGLATVLMFSTTAFAQDDDTDDDVELEEESMDAEESEDEMEEDLTEDDESEADEDVEDVEDEEDVEETVEEQTGEDSILLLYRDDLITYLNLQYAGEFEIAATVEGLDWEHSSVGLTTKVHGYEIYRVKDDSELREYDPRMIVMFDTEVINEEEVGIEIRQPLQLRFDGAYDMAYVASAFNMPDNMKHAALLGTEEGVFEPGESRIPMVIYVDAEQAAYFDEEFADLVISGEYNFSESVPGQDGRRNGQSSNPFMIVEDIESVEPFEFYWDDLSKHRFADKELVNSFEYDDFIVETGFVDLKVSGMEMTILDNIDPEQDRNPLDGDNYGAITVEIELTNHTDDPISSTAYRTGLTIDGQRNSEQIYNMQTYNIYPGDSVITYDTFLVPANQIESYQSIELEVTQLRDAHNNALVEREEFIFELLNQ